MEKLHKLILLEHSLDKMLQENEGPIVNCDERLLAFIRDKQRSSKLEQWNSQDESGNGLLHSAARCDIVVVAQYLIENGSNVNIKNNLGQTPLMIATKNVSKKMVETLLAADADPNAMDNQHRSSLYYLYDFSRTHSEDHLQILKMFIDYGASLSLTVDNLSCSQIDLVLRYGNREAIELLMQANLDLSKKHEDNNTPVHFLAKNENFEVFKALDNYIFDANSHNANLQTPLFFGSFYGNVQTIQYLLDRDADVHGINILALHQAIYNFNTGCGERYAKCIELLLEQHMDMEYKTFLYVALMFNNVKDKLIYDTGKIAIAYLVVREALGTKITDKIRSIIKINTLINIHYKFCQQQLSAVIYNSVTLLDLLSASELKFEEYVRNQVWLSKMQEFCDENTSDSQDLGKILQTRINRANRMIKLKMDSASILCNIIKFEYAIFYLAANRIISFLSKTDLHFLSRALL